MLDEVKTDRDNWREQANKITTLIEGHSAKLKGLWAHLVVVNKAVYFPPIGDKPPASSRSASANLLMIFSPEF
ncbi:MAG: hypothetical protein COB39_01485 [Marinosulfonomonas sp.]|nr:MAG: hypothetical protein COB39_01485 [Marinosulfonomonas sp.]